MDARGAGDSRRSSLRGEGTMGLAGTLALPPKEGQGHSVPVTSQAGAGRSKDCGHDCTAESNLKAQEGI